MKTSLILLAVVSALSSPLLRAEEQNAAPARLGVQFDLQPSTDAKGNYVVTSEIRDLESNKLLGSPKLVFSTAAPAKIEMGVAGNYMVKISVGVNQDNQKAHYEFSYSRDGKVISQQNLNFQLKS
ncbi:MAG: hypothetical protein V4488_24060 [Pseudomonadota bacterium]